MTPSAPMVSSDEDRTRRAELAKELGFFAATLDPVDIERHRRLNAALDSAPTRDGVASKRRVIASRSRRAASASSRM